MDVKSVPNCLAPDLRFSSGTFFQRYIFLRGGLLLTQHQMRKAQTDFIQNTVNRDIKENSKRFWSDVKSKRQEPTGVSPPFK
jgi:hypothetical protein